MIEAYFPTLPRISELFARGEGKARMDSLGTGSGAAAWVSSYQGGTTGAIPCSPATSNLRGDRAALRRQW